MPKLAALHKVSGAKAAWISVANPLFLISFVASAHNDAFMVGLALAGTYYAATRRGVLGVVLVAGSIGIKPITLVLLPFIGLLWAGPGASWARIVPLLVLHRRVGAGLIMALIGWANGYGFGWLSVMLGTGTGAVMFAPLGALNALLSGALSTIGLPTDWILPLLKLIGRLASVGLVFLLIFKGKSTHLIQRMALAFSALVILSPIIQPWYILWLLPFFAVTGIRDDWQCCGCISPPHSSLPSAPPTRSSSGSSWATSTRGSSTSQPGISWAAMFYLAFVDPRTRVLFRALVPVRFGGRHPGKALAARGPGDGGRLKSGEPEVARPVRKRVPNRAGAGPRGPGWPCRTPPHELRGRRSAGTTPRGMPGITRCPDRRPRRSAACSAQPVKAAAAGHRPAVCRTTRALESVRERSARVPVLRRLTGGGENSPDIAIGQGLLASLMVMVGSWGVGWIPSSQESVLSRSRFLLPLRVEMLGVVALHAAAGTGLHAALPRLAAVAPTHPDRRRRDRLRVLRRAIWTWSVPLFFSFPILSKDVYSYLGQGRLMHAGRSPYQDWVSQLPGWFAQGSDSLWAESSSPYGPLFLMFARFTYFVSGGVPEYGVAMMRLVAVAGVALCLYAIPRLAEHTGGDGAWALWISVANPLFLLNMIAGVHNDGLMIGGVLLGFLLVFRKRHVLGVLVAALAVAIKPIVVLVLPFLGLAMVAARCRAGRKDPCLAAHRCDRRGGVGPAGLGLGVVVRLDCGDGKCRRCRVPLCAGRAAWHVRRVDRLAVRRGPAGALPGWSSASSCCLTGAGVLAGHQETRPASRCSMPATRWAPRWCWPRSSSPGTCCG